MSSFILPAPENHADVLSGYLVRGMMLVVITRVQREKLRETVVVPDLGLTRVIHVPVAVQVPGDIAEPLRDIP